MLGYAPDELIGRKMHELIHHTKPDGTPYPETDCPIFHAAPSGQATRSEEDVLFREDGAQFAAEYSSSPIRQRREITGAIITFQDITRESVEKRRCARATTARRRSWKQRWIASSQSTPRAAFWSSIPPLSRPSAIAKQT